MFRVVRVALLAAVVSFSIPSLPVVANSNYVTPDGAARMMAAKGVKAQWTEAREICIEAGLKSGSDQFLHCFQEYQMLSLRALKTRAKALTDAVASQYGLCIDRRRFEITRCTEI